MPPLDDTNRGTRKVISKWLRKKTEKKAPGRLIYPLLQTQ